MYNFRINNCDTDSISFNKSDDSPFSIEEQKFLLNQINELSPDKILWEDDGYYATVVILKAKNYVLHNPDNKDPKKRLVIKGSALKSSKMEPALKELQQEIIGAILKGETSYTEIYNKYILQALRITDKEQMKRWVSKKTFTAKLETSERTNETKQLDALQGSNYKEGDKFYLLFKSDESLCLLENFTGDYHKDKMLEKCYKSVQIFSQILPTEELFLNYKLKRSKKLLDELVGIVVS